MTGGDPHAELFEVNRRRLLGIAYGMLGSVMDAEDVTQDVYLRWRSVDLTTVESPAAYLTTMTTRLSINLLKSARVRREEYVGPWLPEPIVVALDEDPGELVATADEFSLAMLMAMERLTPTERAALILRDVLDLDYAEIADVVDSSPANCRQLVARARSHVTNPERRVRVTDDEARRLVASYVSAVASGDVETLAAVFAEDVVLWADGGGKARAARHPLHGRLRVARHLYGVRTQTPPGTHARIVRINGDPGLAAWLDGRCIAVLAFDVVDGQVQGVRAILNPDKLGSVSP